MPKLETTLRQGASKYDNERIQNHILEIQRILATLNPPSPLPSWNISVGEPGSCITPVGPRAGATVMSASENGTSWAPHRQCFES